MANKIPSMLNSQFQFLSNLYGGGGNQEATFPQNSPTQPIVSPTLNALMNPNPTNYSPMSGDINTMSPYSSAMDMYGDNFAPATQPAESPTLTSLMSPYQSQMNDFTYNTFRPTQSPPIPPISQPIVSPQLDSLMNTNPYSPLMNGQTDTNFGDTGQGFLPSTFSASLLSSFDDDFNPKNDFTENPIVSQATTPSSNMTSQTGQLEVSGPPVDTSIGRDVAMPQNQGKLGYKNVAIGPMEKEPFDYLQNIKSVPAGSLDASSVVADPVNASEGFSVTGLGDEIDFSNLTPSITGEELMNNPEYKVPFSTGGGGMTDVTESQFAEAVPVPEGGSIVEKLGGAANIAGGAMMAGSNLYALDKYNDALGDVRDGLFQVPGMISDATQGAINQIDDTRSILNTSVEKAENSANQDLLSSLDKLRKPNNAVSSIRTTSNNIRKNLNEGLDSVIESAEKRLTAQIRGIQDNKRDQLASIDALKETLKAKEKELEKERKQAIVGTAVGVGSIFADAVAPGSGMVLRTGWNQYASRT